MKRLPTWFRYQVVLHRRVPAITPSVVVTYLPCPPGPKMDMMGISTLPSRIPKWVRWIYPPCPPGPKIDTMGISAPPTWSQNGQDGHIHPCPMVPKWERWMYQCATFSGLYLLGMTSHTVKRCTVALEFSLFFPMFTHCQQFIVKMPLPTLQCMLG